MVRHNLYAIVRTPVLYFVVACLLTLPGCASATPSQAPPEPVVSTVPQITLESQALKGPSFAVSNLQIAPAEAKIRDGINVSVIVTNDGDAGGSYQVSLEINGSIIAIKQITLNAGASDTVSFKTSQESPGDYQVNVNGCRGTFVIIPPPPLPPQPLPAPQTTGPVPMPPPTKLVPQQALPGPIKHSSWTIPTGSGTNYRAVHMGGNWGTNRPAALRLPEEYFLYLRDMNVDWVGISVALHVDGSMDSTVELKYDEKLSIPSFTDEVLRSLITTFRSHGFNVYVAMAFEFGDTSDHPFDRWQLGDPLMHTEDTKIAPEYWPWRTDYPQHQSFVAQFWQSYTDAAVHIARIAEECGAGMFSLGTETDRLFRSRSGGRWTNNFLKEMKAMVNAVRNVYHGQLGYDMHYQAIADRGFFGPGSDYLVADLGLDFVGISAYFQLAQNTPPSVPSTADLEKVWDSIFNTHLKPLQQRNGNKPIIFTEFGYVDALDALRIASAEEFSNKAFTDKDGNGKDDGEEAQANSYAALFNIMDKYPGVVKGAFLWDMNMATQQEYQQSYAAKRTFNIRGKVAEKVVKDRYAGWR